MLSVCILDEATLNSRSNSSTTYPTSHCSFLQSRVFARTRAAGIPKCGVRRVRWNKRRVTVRPLSAWHLSGDSGGTMWARLLLGTGGSGLGLRASRDGLLRLAGARCAGKRQLASSGEVSAPTCPMCACMSSYWTRSSKDPFWTQWCLLRPIL